jgi:A/G-specific adenine glycosylase
MTSAPFLDAPFGDYSGEVVPDDYEILRFRELIYAFYGSFGRDFPWRNTKDPYAILVSEIMLQQTQTDRVLPKYVDFMTRWPNIYSLSRSSLAEVYACWQGLGYNRRAKALLDIARIVANELQGKIPETADELRKLPMVGQATAAAIRSFAYDKPSLYLETNVRRVFIYFFFEGRKDIRDNEIMPLLEAAVDVEESRQWYYALMDYGVFLKTELPNPNRRSAHYTQQSQFEGSNRQIRGSILRYLSEKESATSVMVAEDLKYDSQRIKFCMQALKKEGMLVCERGNYQVAD